MNMLDELAQETFTAPEYVTSDEVIAAYERDKPPAVAIDTESRTFRWFIPDVNAFAFQVSWGHENTYYVDVRGRKAPAEQEQRAVSEWVLDLFERANAGEIKILFFNAKYDLHVLRKMARLLGISLPELLPHAFEDCMLLSHCLEEARYHGLKELCDAYDIRYSDADASFLKEQIHGWINEQSEREGREVGFDEVPDYLMVPYSIQDGFLTWALWEREFKHQLEEMDPDGLDVKRIYQLEKELVPVLVEAEEHGMRIDPDFVYGQLAELGPALESLRLKCLKELGLPEDEPFNPGSTEDVAAALKKFDLIDDEKWMNPATGKYKLPEWVLETIKHPVAQLVLEYRLAQKLLTSYFEPLAEYNYDDGTGQRIVSCNIKQVGTRTGRMSITEPALQTIPREKGNVREAFIAREGCDLIFADWSQQELRVLAHYMSYYDTSMLDILTAGADMHLEAAAAIWQKDQSEVTKEERSGAKAVNFAITYGAGQAKLSEMLGVPLHEGKVLLNKYHRRFPGIRWMKKTAENRMKSRQYVVTIFGRRHRERDGKFAYKATNSIIQGTSADMAKTAMVKVRNRFKELGMEATVVLQIHDELVVECPEAETERACEVVREIMCDFPEFRLPIEVDVAVAKRWSEAK